MALQRPLVPGLRDIVRSIPAPPAYQYLQFRQSGIIFYSTFEMTPETRAYLLGLPIGSTVCVGLARY